MKKDYLYYYLLLTFGLLMFFNSSFFAWNNKAHELISEVAYQKLSPDQQKKLNSMLKSLVEHLPIDDRAIYDKQEPELSRLSKLSIMPDYWKRLPTLNYSENFSEKGPNFIEIIDRLNIKMGAGEISEKLADLQTSQWHSQSQLIWRSAENQFDPSDLEKSGKLNFAVSQLLNNIKQTKDPAAKAIGIIYLSHIVADAHQPLHAFSRIINSAGDHDQNGNLFCLDYLEEPDRDPKAKCETNLHSFWDSAGYVFVKKRDVYPLVSFIIDNYFESLYQNKSDLNDSNTWIAESFSFWKTVYNTPQYQYPNKIYVIKARGITLERIALAGYRLDKLLENILD
ncbi:MAG: hypothetical protein KBD64_03510 [Gammaproteobacteria bacterium]|nr:hypothetical protein [Gammaproteobacteria bacterium]